MLTIREQIERNKRGSAVFAFLLLALLVALTTVLVGIYSPKNWYFGSGGGVVLAVIAWYLARFQGPGILLALNGAREASREDYLRLNNIVEEMAIAARIPAPKIYVIDDPSPNAFATGTDPENGIVCVTRGLMDMMNRDELQGVMAHEIGHIRNYDIRYMTTVAILAGMIPMIADLIRNILWWGGGNRSSDDDDRRDAGIFALVGIILSIVAPLFAVMIQLAISRKREFLADATAAELTRNPEGLASALMKIDGLAVPMQNANHMTQHMYLSNPFKDGGESLFSTHPSTRERVKALMGLAGLYRRDPGLPPNGNQRLS